jgi:hypothetical protein
VELFVDPGEEGDGTIVEAVAEGLRFRGLKFVVGVTFFPEPVTSGDPCLFKGGVWGQSVLNGLCWKASDGWRRGGVYVVDM